MASILIINQQHLISSRLKDILQHIGHKTVGIAETTLDALTLIERVQPDIIFLDLCFGEGHDGPQFAQIALNNSAAKLVYVVSNAGKAVAERARATNPDGYLVYPFEEQDVYMCTSACLDPTSKPEIPTILLDLLDGKKAQIWNQLPEKTLIKVRAYVRGNLDKEITLKSMASVAGMSESNFSRRFKASMSITPYQYVLQERLEEAKHMLRHHDISLVHIAAATGFSSQSHFSTVFRKYTNLTPLQYRRQ